MVLSEDTAICTAYDEFECWDPAEPEKNLMRAILRSAMDDVRKSGHAYREARAYLMSNDNSHLYTFISICWHLGICPNAIRRMTGLPVSLAERDAIAA